MTKAAKVRLTHVVFKAKALALSTKNCHHKLQENVIQVISDQQVWIVKYSAFVRLSAMTEQHG